MKRLFGLIGFTFLFVLSAVFYSDFNEIVFAIIGSLGLLSVAVGIFLIIILIKKLQQADIFVMKSSPPIHHAVS